MPHLMAALLCAALVLGAPAAARSGNALTLHCAYPESSLYGRAMRALAADVLARTGGEVRIAVPPEGMAGLRGPELLETVRDGAVPMALMLMGEVSRSERAFAISTLPLLARSPDDARRLHDSCRPLYETLCAHWNQTLLLAAPWPASGLFSREPLRTEADLAGRRRRVYDTTMAGFFSRAGARPADLPWVDLASALNGGVLDAVLTSPSSARDVTLWEHLHHFLALELAYPLTMLTINAQALEALAPAHRAALRDAAARAQEDLWRDVAREEQRDLAVLRNYGIEARRPEPALQQALEALADDMRREFLWRAGADAAQALRRYEEGRRP